MKEQSKETKALLARIIHYCRTMEIPETTFGARVNDDTTLVARVRDGSNMREATAKAVIAYLDEEHRKSRLFLARDKHSRDK